MSGERRSETVRVGDRAIGVDNSFLRHLLPMLRCRRPAPALPTLTIGAPGIGPAGVVLTACVVISPGLGALIARLSTSSPSEKAGGGAWGDSPLAAGLEGRRSLKKSSEAISAQVDRANWTNGLHQYGSAASRT